MTLIELIMVMVMVSILAGFISSLIFYEINTYELLTNRKEGMQNSRYALHLMTRDIRQIMKADSIFHASSDSIRFDDISDIMVSYKYQNNKIFRNNDLLLDNISSFYFGYLDGSGNILSSPVTDPTQIRTITLSLSTLVRGQAVNSQLKVSPRNF